MQRAGPSQNRTLIYVLAATLGLASIITLAHLGVREFESRKFRSGDPGAIARMAMQGPSVAPEMLAGLESEDVQYQNACRQVLFRLWPQLDKSEREVAIQGQIKTWLELEPAADDLDRVHVRLYITSPLSGGVTLHGDGLKVHVDGREVPCRCGRMYAATVPDVPITPLFLIPKTKNARGGGLGFVEQWDLAPGTHTIQMHGTFGIGPPNKLEATIEWETEPIEFEI